MHDPQPLIAALRNPALFGPQCRVVQVLETHISWVILTGQHAYKLKKPVNFGFLDFSTLSQRRFACHEEIRLNQRLAAPLYLGIVPITGSIERPEIGGAGPILEYAVKLRQFDQAELGDSLAQDQRLEARHIDDLAATLAEFHAAAPRSRIDDAHGLPESILAAAAQNFSHLNEIADETVRLQLDELSIWTNATFHKIRPTLLQRKCKGFVRECHGDLHLGNVLLVDGRLMPFDCIEFSEDLRWIDVISELAFMVMDLDVRGYPSLASRLTNRYLEMAGDYPGLELLDFYRVYRAMVRAKIAGLSLGHCDRNGQQRADLETRLRDYLGYATSVIRPRATTLLITHGFSGSGKSHWANAIAEAWPAVRLSSDIERKRLAGLAATAKTAAGPLEGIYAPEFTRRTYEHLAATARLLLRAGFNVIVDATFLIAAHRDAQRRLADECNARFVILDLRAPEAILRLRIEKRRAEAADPSEADFEVLLGQFEYAEPLSPEEQMRTLPLNSEETPDLPAIISALAKSQLSA